jgi:hypothetical protein
VNSLVSTSITSEEIAAVERFQKTGDVEKFKAALKTKNPQTAYAAVARVTGWQARNERLPQPQLVEQLIRSQRLRSCVYRCACAAPTRI